MSYTKVEEMELSEQAEVVLRHRYLLRDEANDIIETPEELFHRVARTVADSTSEEAQFFYAMKNLEFVPNSPTLMNAGTKQGTLSACFVLPLEDSMEGIMKAAKDSALVQKFGGGTGFSLSGLRPRGDRIKTTHGIACGPIEVLKTLSRVSSMITQGGKRDGANMAGMSGYHPDILSFIECKATEGDIHNFNISVGVDSDWMARVEKDLSYNLVNPRDGSVVGRLQAREVFDKIIQGAWRNGEPGMVFLDQMNKDNHVEATYGLMTATNPCGEQPLLANESCNLGSINLAKFFREDTIETDWERLEKITRLGVRFLDNVIDVNYYATPEIEEMTKDTRKIGLGVMGFADLLLQMHIPYDSEAARALAWLIIYRVRTWADQESLSIAKRKGNFPAWGDSDYSEEQQFRNHCRLTVAPTGTISMIADTSSGIEPIFALAWKKQNILEGQTLNYVNKYFERDAHRYGFYSEELMSYLAAGGALSMIPYVPDWVKEVYATAPEISPEAHVRMQATFQSEVDSGISKTINFANSATLRDVEDAYMLAWKEKCKGITVYRAGSREQEVLVKGNSERPEACCDSAHIVMESGCETCKACGWSACLVA